jgi:hypothetical protein
MLTKHPRPPLPRGPGGPSGPARMRSAAQRSRITGDEARPGRDVANPPAIPIFPRTAPNPGRRAKESPQGDGHLPRHTSIYFDRLGEGPPVVLISGGSVDRSSNAGLAAELAGSGFTAYNYDRRGRGDSGDTQPYAIEREVEDIAAVIEAAGGRAHLYGSSSGAALGMHAAAVGLPITKLAMWEPPYSVNGRPDLPADTASVYRELVATGRRGDAAEYFMAKVVGMPPEFVARPARPPGGPGRRPWPTRRPTTPRSWATTPSRRAGPLGSGADPDPDRRGQLWVLRPHGRRPGRADPRRPPPSSGGPAARRRPHRPGPALARFFAG